MTLVHYLAQTIVNEYKYTMSSKNTNENLYVPSTTNIQRIMQIIMIVLFQNLNSL